MENTKGFAVIKTFKNNMLYLSMIKRNIIFISSLLFILSSCDNDDIPMYFRSMQPSGGKLFEGSIKEYYLNSIPQNMYIGSKNYIFDSTYSEEQLEAQFEKYFFSDLGLKGKEFHFIPLAVLMLPIAEGADFGVQIIRGPRYIDLEIHFDKNKMINDVIDIKDAKIIIRYRHGGEKIYSNSLKQSKSIKQLFQEHNVLPWLRNKVPLIYINEKLAVVPGFCVDRNYLATVKSYNEANQEYNELNQNTIDFVIMKILTIINSIEDLNLIIHFNNNIYNLSESDSNLEIRNFSKKLYKRFK